MLLCICMVFTLLPVTAWAAASDHADKVKVAGTELTTTGYYDVSNLGTRLEDAPEIPGSNGYVHWESTTGTLTLYGATIDGGSNSSGIYADENYTIILSESTVSNVKSGYTNAVTSDGSVTIKGSGTLNATGATNGIDADYTVSIADGATVNAIGTSGMGIYISGSLNYWDGLVIESTAASVTITGNTYGVGYANTSAKAPEIKSHSVTVTGETAAFQVAPTLNGVGAKASNNINGDAPETYDSTKLSDYKWFKSEALPSVSVTGVTVDPASLALTEGASDTLTATVAPNNAANKTVTWTSSNPAIATVDANGRVTAVAAGSATITATTSDGSFSDTCVVTVTVISVTNYDLWVGGVRVNSDNAADVLGDGKVSYDADSKTLTLNGATIECDTKEPIYSEDDLTIKLVGTNAVTTTSQGNAILIVAGKLAIEGTGTLNATSNNYCIQAHGGDIVISGATVTAEGTGTNARGIYAAWNAGTGGNVTITGATVNSTGKTYGICASNDITISDSTVTATSISMRDGVSAHGIDGGNITITDSTVTVTAECTNWGSYGIYGSPFNGCKITITDSTVTAKTVTTEDGVTSKAFSMAPVFGDSPNWYQWTTTESGAMTKSTDTPYTYDASHTYLKIEPIIAPAATPVTGVTVAPASLALTEGDSSMLTATVAPDNATNKTVTWTSSNPAVATVDANGKITAVAAGTATITATTEDGGKTATCAVTVSHDYTAHTKKAEALKTAGNCRDYAVYYYSCSACGEVENNDSHTFNGDKIANSHVGGTTLVNSSEANHKTQTDGYTGDTKCLGCGEIISYGQSIPAGAHTPANVWSTGGEYHWKECTVVGCGIVIDGSKAEHSSTGSNVAACQKAAVCDVCGVSYGTVAAHDFANTWSKDASGHWYACQTAGCTEKNGFSTHTPDHQGGATEEYAIKCTICGYEIEAQLGHTHVFDKEVVEDQYLVSKANCTDPAKYYKSCKCGEKGIETFVSGTALGHTEGTDWKSDKDNHWHTCIVAGCGVIIDSSKAAHTPDRNVATETDAVKCSVCGYVITPALGHTHAYGTDWKSDKDNHWNECACGGKANSTAHKDENKDGKCDVCAYNVGVPTTPTDSSSPQTGDNNMLWMWIALLFVSGFGVVTTTLLGKKRFFTK